MKTQTPKTERQTPMQIFKRLLPLLLVVVVFVGFFATGLNKYLSFDEIARNYGALNTAVTDHPILSGVIVVLVYALAIALSFPAAWLLTVAAGLVFGWVVAACLVVVGATLGAAGIYLVTRFALADFFRKRAGKWLNKMADGFRDDAVGYMLFLRLAPVVPFSIVNVVPAILGVSFVTYVWTTFVGIIPGVIAYAYAGEGLRSIVAERATACETGITPCGDPFSAANLVTPQILIAFFALGAVSLIPVVLKRLKAARSAA